MAIIDSKCKLCRRAGEKLFLKGDRCLSPKCAMVRRPYAPGIHGHTPSRGGSEFGKQLAMKQKIKHLYGVMERQFRHHFDEVKKTPGVTGDQLLSRLERRLDNVVYRLGLASSRRMARLVVGHGHITVNGKILNIPSYQVKKGNIIAPKELSLKSGIFAGIEERMRGFEPPRWLSLDKSKKAGTVMADPEADDVQTTVDITKIKEFYSR